MKSATLVLTALALMLGGAGRAGAGFIITFSQAGNDVVATGTGSVNLAGLTPGGAGGGGGGLVAALAGTVVVGTTSAFDTYIGITGPASFGPGVFHAADQATGDGLGLVQTGAITLFVPQGYSSGSTLTGTATWDNTTVNGLGLTPGTYDWHWGSGGPDQTFEVVIPATAAPEPASLTLLGLGLAGMAGYGWRRRKA